MNYLFKFENIKELKAPSPFERYAKIIFDQQQFPDTPVSMALFRFAPGQIGPKHSHDIEVELYITLKGEGNVKIDGIDHPMMPGSVIYIPARSVHETFNVGNEDLEFLGVFAPALNFNNIRNWEPNL